MKRVLGLLLILNITVALPARASEQTKPPQSNSARVEGTTKTSIGTMGGALILSQVLAASGDAINGEKVAKSFVEEYAKEQIKHQLANYLNKNPSWVGSTSTTVGTDALKFVGDVLAVYNLLSAKTDKQRAWAAMNLVISPEPVTAVILIAVQIVDTLVSMEHARDLKRMQEEITDINENTMEILSRYYLTYYGRQAEILNRALESQTKLRALQIELFQLDRNTLEGITRTLEVLLELDQNIFEHKINFIHIKGVVDVDRLTQSTMSLKELEDLNNEFQALAPGLKELRFRIHQFFNSLNAHKRKQEIDRQLFNYVTQLRLYTRCVELVNARWSQEGDALLENECQAEFNLGQEI